MVSLFLISLLILTVIVLMLKNVWFGLAIFLYSLAIFNYIFFYSYSNIYFLELLKVKDFFEITEILINFGKGFILDLENSKLSLITKDFVENEKFNIESLYNFLMFIIIVYFKLFSNIFATIPFFLSRYISFNIKIEEKENDNFIWFWFITNRQIKILKNMFQYHIFFIVFMFSLWSILYFNLQF